MTKNNLWTTENQLKRSKERIQPGLGFLEPIRLRTSRINDADGHPEIHAAVPIGWRNCAEWSIHKTSQGTDWLDPLPQYREGLTPERKEPLRKQETNEPTNWLTKSTHSKSYQCFFFSAKLAKLLSSELRDTPASAAKSSVSIPRFLMPTAHEMVVLAHCITAVLHSRSSQNFTFQSNLFIFTHSP